MGSLDLTGFESSPIESKKMKNGVKGDKLTEDSAITAASLEDKLSSIGDISVKKMFGGYGIFHKEKMFGIVDSKGQGYLKVDEENQRDYEENHCHKHGKMPYFSIPNTIFENEALLQEWAKKAMEITK